MHGKVFEDTLDEKTSTIENDFKTRLASLKDAFQTSYDEAKKTADSLALDTQGNTKQLAMLNNTLDAKTGDLQKRYDGMFDKVMKEAEEKEAEAYNKYSSISSSNLQKYHDLLQGKMNEMQKSVNQTVSDLSQKADDIRNTIESSIENLRNQFLESERASQITAEKVNGETQQSIQRLAEFDEKIQQTMQGIATEYDAREAKFLSGIDKQLEEYKKEMEARFKRLSDASTDVDKLENTLRNLMDKSQKKVAGDFDKFEAAVKDRESSLNEELEQIQTSVEELKKKAYLSASTKLKSFEDTFEVDLKSREEELSRHLIEWKNDFENKINIKP